LKGNIYLSGFMGSGKSSVGLALARRLGLGFLDLDRQVERRAGLSLPRLFERGEEAFRRLESSALRQASRLRGRVVALGGGALLDPCNRRLVKGSGILVSLVCSERELWRRLKPELALRPLLQGPKPRSRLRALLRNRRRLYASADLRVSTTGRSPEQAAVIIARRLGA